MKHLLLTTIAAVVVVGCGPPPPDISIHDAAKKGNIEAVKQHLAAGADVNAKEDGGLTPLQMAVVNFEKEVAELLIAKGADVNAKDEDGELTPLQIAIMGGFKEIAELLIAKGADVNWTDGDSTLLHEAVDTGQKEIAELMIAKGADVNAKAWDDGTPLDDAIEFKHPETTDLLRKHGAKTAEELKAEGK